MGSRYQKPLDRWLNRWLTRPWFWVALLLFWVVVALVVRSLPMTLHQGTMDVAAPVEDR